MKAMRLPKKNLDRWLSAMMTSGKRVIGPVKLDENALFSTITRPDDLVLDNGITLKSAKGVFFPQSEVILRYGSKEGRTTVEDVSDFAPPTVLVGVRPCDAAALETLDDVFQWDYKDKFYLERREKTVVVAMGCREPIDGQCFCTSVGLAPDSRKGSDVFMIETPEGDFYVEFLTEKGEHLLSLSPELFAETAPLQQGELTEDIPPVFNVEDIQPWLDEHFEDDFWKERSLACIGCGTCTFLCPTCHCFDIVDETRLGKGVRRKNWDSCQFAQFTLHASGHNPRGAQSERYRQRIMHKFKYYPEKFGKTLCVGCGRCVRSCPVGHSLLDYLVEIAKRSKQQQA